MPKCCLLRCLLRRKRDIYFERARALLADEMDVVKLLRQMRFVLAAIKELIPAKELAQLRIKTEYMPIEIPTKKDTPSEP